MALARLAEIGEAAAAGASGATGVQWPLLLGYLAMSTAGGLGMYFGIGGALELLYYRRRAEADEWKSQPRKWPSPKARRSELRLGAFNMVLGSFLSGLFVYHLATGGRTGVYFDLREHGLPFTVASALAYFLTTDYLLYWAHRTYHVPALYRTIHKVHHRYGAPTAFTALAMHPVELLTYQLVMLVPLFFWPMHVVPLVGLLVYLNFVAAIDHSGVKLHSWFPWQPPATFHDDHHLHFHVNYGQTLGLWDRLHGTWRRYGRTYGAEVFGGKGATLGPALEQEGQGSAPRFVDYSREAARAADRARRAADAP